MKFSYDKGAKSDRRYLKTIGIVVAVLAFISAIGWVGVRQWYKANLKPLSSQQEDIIVVVEPGSTTVEIATLLEEKEVIRSATAFNWYVSGIEEKQYLQAGTYRLSPAFSVEQLVDILVSGRVDSTLVTILPGLRLDEVANGLVESGFDKTEVDAALAASYKHMLLADKPPASSLEGYIYPETYQITTESSVESLLEHSFDTFYANLSDEILAGIRLQGLDLHEAIILASIVQKEISNPDDQRMVAQVFLSRLEQGIVLGSDVTFFYAAEITGQDASPDLDSPYNTRINPGLPPGPISNFNLSALEAVANPADTDYLYFVAGDDGNTYFAKTLAEHEANAAKHCIELCQL